MKDQIRHILSDVVHPATGVSITGSGCVDKINSVGGKITVSLTLEKDDPEAQELRRRVKERIVSEYPSAVVTVYIREKQPAGSGPGADKGAAPTVASRVIAISSGKGGVGKSTVTSNLAVSLTGAGYRVGVLDADIYGPSQPKMFGVEGYLPAARGEKGEEKIVPASTHGIELMSIGFFIKPSDALVWRGPMATNALRQLIQQTAWSALDYLLIDLPPGTGDIHLTVLTEMKIDGAVIVTTPQEVAQADVVRGIEMFRADNIGIPILGIVENMSWFTPAELPDNKYYIFGKGCSEDTARTYEIPLLGQIPLYMSVAEGSDNGTPASLSEGPVKTHYAQVIDKLLANPLFHVEKKC